MLMVHRDAAVKTTRRPRQTNVSPVETIRVRPEALKLAHKLADCACKVQPRPDGSVYVLNRHRCAELRGQ